MKHLSIEKKLTIDYLKKGYESGAFTPEEVCLEIVKRANETKDMNIWIQPPEMEKMQKYLEALKEKNPETALLWGIPFAIKDNIDLAGVETSAGCETYAYLPKESATTVKLLIEQGAIPVGKTNLDQFATGLVGTRSLYGEVHNALKEEMISGGSSSGSAVCVAMGQAAFALGTDTAGSGRVPAALNDLVGFKPSLGAWSTKGVVPACASLDCVTVFAHTLEDAQAVDMVERSYDAECSWSREIAPLEKKVPEKICIPETELTFFGPYAKAYKEKWESVIRNLEKLGIPIEYIDYSIFSEAAAILYDGPWIAERWAALGDFVEKNQGQAMVPVTEKILRSGNKEDLKADSVFQAMHRLAEIKCQVKKILRNSVLLMPTSGGTYTREQVDADPIQTNSNMGLYTNHCNLLDLCALDFQTGFAAEDIPFGVTGFALSGQEGLNMELAKLYQLMNLQETDQEKTGKQKGNEQTEDKIELAVCGLHMRGLALEHQLLELGAEFVEEAETAPYYKLIKLPTEPAKPGLIKTTENGKKIQVEVWNIPKSNLGEFLGKISAPLGLGRIQLEKKEVLGFICEGYMEYIGEDISELGSWRKISYPGFMEAV